MIVGVAKEVKKDEYRVSVTPSGVEALVQSAHKVLVQKSAGLGSGFDDELYLESGAVIVDSLEEIYEQSELICKVKEPIEQEYKLLKEGQILFTYLHLAATKELTQVLLEKNITAFAYETLELNGKLPLLEPMSEVAGKMASLHAAVHLGRLGGGSGRLLGGVLGVENNHVLILGGGIAGAAAAKVAAGMGADVTILDLNLERLRYLDDSMPDNVTVRISSQEAIRTLLPCSDVVIGTVLLPGEKTPKLISYDMLKLLKKGSVIVDVSIDQGGCFETSRPTTHSQPVYEVDGILHYCVANMPGAYPRTSTLALTSVTLPYIISLVKLGVKATLEHSHQMKKALNIYKGKVTNEGVKKAHKL